jgi:hypothetical protein
MHTRPASRPVSRSVCSLRPARAGFRCAVASALALLIGACATRGNGEPGEDDRTVESFHGVDVGGVLTLDAAEGSPSVHLAGDANLLPLVETRVEDGILHVTTRERVSASMPLVVRVRTPELREVDVGGASDATIETSQPSFELDVSGASEVRARGTTQMFDLDVSGASDVEATELRAQKVDVEASGASEAHVTATESLDAEASGASEITYGGGATQVKKDASGASTIVARD